MTEDGPAPWLSDFGLKEENVGYAARTRLNVAAADFNIIFLFTHSKGTLDTIELCKKMDKAYIVYDKNFKILEAKYRNPIKSILFYKGRNAALTVNIAGNRESKAPGIRDSVYDFLMKGFEKLK